MKYTHEKKEEKEPYHKKRTTINKKELTKMNKQKRTNEKFGTREMKSKEPTKNQKKMKYKRRKTSKE